MYIAIATAGAAVPAMGLGRISGAPFPWPDLHRAQSARVSKRRRSGLGATPTAIASGAITGVNTGAATAIGTGSEVAGGIAGGLEVLAPFTGPAAPFVAALGAIVGPIASMFKGCGVTCQQTTDIANKVATAAGQITAAYWAQSVRTQAMQAAAVSNLQQLYQYLIQNCQAIGGRGGSQCVADRQPGGKYDFQAQQIAPIQNDTAVVPDPVSSTVASAATSIGLPAAVANSGLLLPIGLAVGAWLLLK